ncbi:hypothetical protein [Streptacidiphilus sp. EB129]|uniref:hypothetical protein n=1 Tax=Streptacidiphilus sp. EB129 TaxID=3156262 RepID=UPI0035164027
MVTHVNPGWGSGTVGVEVTSPGGTSAPVPGDHYTYATAGLSFTLAAIGVPGLLGGHINYTITVTDNGPSALTSATVTATLPSPMTATSSWIRVPVRGPDPDLPSVAVRAVVGARWSVLVAGHSVGSGPVASA